MSFLFASASSPSSEVEFALLFWAMIGGIAVFVGLGVEKIADWMNERFLDGSYKPHKTLEEVGWCILMFGIFVEIAVAGWSANDAWQTRQIAINNYPLNQPVSDISANVVISLMGTQSSTSPTWWGASEVADLVLIDTNMPQSFAVLIAYTFQRFDRVGIDETYGITFHEDLRNLYGRGVAKWPTVAEIMSNVTTVATYTKFIPHDAQPYTGNVEFLINGGIHKHFQIHYQKPLGKKEGEWATGYNDDGFTIIATSQ